MRRLRNLRSDADLIRAAVDASGLSAQRFAQEFMGVDGRSLRRWLAGDSPIRNAKDRAWLVAYVDLHVNRPAFWKQLE